MTSSAIDRPCCGGHTRDLTIDRIGIAAAADQGHGDTTGLVGLDGLLGVAGPVATHGVDVGIDGRAMAGVVDDDGAHRAVRAGRLEHGQAVIDRSAGGFRRLAANPTVALGPGQPAGLARGESGQDYLFELCGQLAGVGVDLGLVFGRNRLAEDIRGHASEAWCTVGVRRSDSKSLACQAGARFFTRAATSSTIAADTPRLSTDTSTAAPCWSEPIARALAHRLLLPRRATAYCAPGSRSAGSTPPA